MYRYIITPLLLCCLALPATADEVQLRQGHPDRYVVVKGDTLWDISARFQTSRDFLLTQRLILQGRFETHAAVQKVEKFTTGSGLNNIELGLRLRYEIRREIAPYIGVSYDRSFFKTADFVREEGGGPSQVRFVAGLRLWF